MQNKQVYVQAPALEGSDSIGFMWSGSQTPIFLKAPQVTQMYFLDDNHQVRARKES